MIELNMAKFNVKNPQTGEYEPLDGASQAKVQSDWNQTDNSAEDFIKNKPNLGTAASKNVDQVPTLSSTNLVESNGVAVALSGKADLENGKIPISQLPSYVDDMLEYEDISSFPLSGETGKIYIARDTNKTYRWSGTTYVEISESLALGETSSTAYAGNKGKANAEAIGTIANLTTTEKRNLVGAVNEVKSEVNEVSNTLIEKMDITDMPAMTKAEYDALETKTAKYYFIYENGEN